MLSSLVSRTVLPPTLKPAISPSVHLSLTVVYTVLYSLLFLIVYVQLWMILYYKHRRFSYQTVFLFLCLVWAALRTTLFSFYYVNCTTANNLDTVLYWLLYCCPVCLQFVTLCLMVIFFAKVYFRGMPTDTSDKYSKPLYVLVILSIVAFLANNITCAVIMKRYAKHYQSEPLLVSYVRVSISGSLFILMGVLLAICIYKMSKVAATGVVLEAKGLTVKQALASCVLIILLYTSRAMYNFVAISKPLNSLINFGYGWINVSDQADLQNLDDGFAYVSFGIVLFVWEFLPTFIVVLFFRVHKPDKISRALSSIPSESFSSRAYFFDNPRRYDSDEDSSRNVHTGNDSILEASGPFSVNSTESTRSYLGPHPVNDMPTISIISPAQTMNTMLQPNRPHTQDSFYDGT